MGLFLLLLILVTVVSSNAVCTRESNPVCASNKKTYSNPCYFRKAQRRDPELIMLHMGHCRTLRTPDVVTSPAEFCPMIYKPVCGSNQQTYSNPCVFKKAQVKDPELILKHNGACRNRRTPDAGVCHFIRDPVCGSDRETYVNPCAFHQAQRRDPELILQHTGACVVRDVVSSVAEVCTREYDPVCASNQKTYGNPCQFKYAQRRDPKLVIEHPGACRVRDGIIGAIPQGFSLRDLEQLFTRILRDGDGCSELKRKFKKLIRKKKDRKNKSKGKKKDKKGKKKKKKPKKKETDEDYY